MKGKLDSAAPTGQKKNANGKARNELTLSNDTGKGIGRAQWGYPLRQLATLIQTMDQGWSPKCESEPSDNNSTWAVIKTTAIQSLRFLEAENKKLPGTLKPRSHLELIPGDLLVTRAGPRSRVGVACLVKSTRPRLMLCDKAYRLRCNPRLVDAAFLEMALNAPHIVDEVNKLKTGISDSGVNLTQKGFGNLLVPVPSVPVQRRIVAEIEKQFTRVEAGVSALRRVQANLKRYRAAVLKAACEGRLVPTEAELAKSGKRKGKFETGEELLARILKERRKNWRGRGEYREPVAATSRLPAIPEGWVWSTFDQLSTLITKGSSPNWQGFNYCDTGIMFVRSENVRWGTLDLDGVAHLPPAFNEKERKSILSEGDVLLNLVGASIGRAAIATVEVEGGNVNQAVAVIRLALKLTVNQFAILWLNSTECQKRIHAEKVDVARANFSLEDTRILPMPLPPLAEQARIVAEVERRLSVVQELEAVVSANLQRAARLRQAILQKAFTGELVGG